MNGKEIDKQIKEFGNFLTKTNSFIDESEEIIREYWVRRKRRDYIVEMKGNLIDITPELIRRECLEVMVYFPS